MKFDMQISTAKDSQEEYDFDRKAEEIAAERGQIVIYSKENELQLDIDSEEAYTEYRKRMDGGIGCDLGITDVKEIPSASGLPHRHITLTLNKKVKPIEAIALQFAFGSDPMREYLNLRRLLNGVENPTRLFQNK